LEQGNFIGPYELRGELGRGAMAKVWRAWDPKLEREVAIKEPLFDARLGEEVITEMGARFVREGVAAARLNHPGIVTIFAADTYDGRPVIVMELVEGMTLREILQTGALSAQVALDVLDQLLDAVGFAHSQGVVHRDIKPDNVFISENGRVKLSDFGIARLDDTSLTRATQMGTVLGTPGYMAPEQAKGEPSDNRTDLFAIGTIAYEMLTGSNPFGASGDSNAASLLYKIVHEPIFELPAAASAGLSSDIRPAVLAALNKDPLERPQDAASFKAMLHGVPVPTQRKPGACSSLSPLTDPTTFSPSSRAKQASAKLTASKKALPLVIVGGVGVLLLTVILVSAWPERGGGGSTAPVNQSGGQATSTQSSGQENAPNEFVGLLPNSDSSALMDVSVGDVIHLGEVNFIDYRGGAFSDDIGWRVLAIENQRALIITEQIIDERWYHDDFSSSTWIRWEKSDLRRWLNSSFYSGLPAGVRSVVLEVENQNPVVIDDIEEFATRDYVFLLSIDEAELYFSTENERQATINFSDYTLNLFANEPPGNGFTGVKQNEEYWWWLRTPCTPNSYGYEHLAWVEGNGEIRKESLVAGFFSMPGVRPAMWVSLEAL